MTIEIKCDSEVVLVPIEDIQLDPKNRNKHPQSQIDHFCKLVSFYGWRQPITISNQTGLVKAGHGRVLGARQLGMTHVPAIFQDFTDDEEKAWGTSDNAIASQAELDMAGINLDMIDLGPGFDVDLFGIPDFKIDPNDGMPPDDLDKAKIDLNPQWIVAVQCAGEHEMQEIFDEMTRRGLNCKLIT